MAPTPRYPLTGKTLGVAFALIGLWSFSCTSHAADDTTSADDDSADPQPAEERVDATFAGMALATIAGEQNHREALLAHPALAALVRHQQMSGNSSPDPGQILDGILASPGNTTSGAANLEYLRDGEAGLWVDALASSAYLPAGASIGGDLFLIVGYDIGVASPPDMALNIAHSNFTDEPAELGFYATHEAHHVGFLSLRPFPDLEHLDDPEVLGALIRFCTQMEGMAVHAAYPAREAAGALGADQDYVVYTDEARAQQVVARYAEVLGLLDGLDQVDGATINQVLSAMSSGERLWYQFGALVSRKIEQDSGREALVSSVTDPAIFDAAVTSLLAH